MNKYYWSGISSDERTKAISELTGIVSKHATIINFQRFSDITLNLVLELEENRLNDLYNSLKGLLYLEGYNSEIRASESECIILLNITFTQSSGDLEIEVPNIPE